LNIRKKVMMAILWDFLRNFWGNLEESFDNPCGFD
jgi:hypothetical protein